MIRLSGLVDLKSVGLAARNLREDAPETPPDNIQGDEPTPSPEEMGGQQNPKAQLMTLQTQVGELYNMLGDGETSEGWVADNIKKAAELVSAAYSHVNYEKNKHNSIGDGEGSPAEKMDSDSLNEKWNGDAKVKKTGEYSGKSEEELKSKMSSLKAQSKSHQDKGEKVPEDVKKKEKQVMFALRAKGGWKKGEGAASK